MHFSSSILVAAALSTVAFAAPAWEIEAGSTDQLTEYFQLLGRKVQEQRSLSAVPVCDLSKAVLPASTLPPPTSNLTLAHVAIGRGTQNYTCDLSNSTAIPVAAGAVATLYNTSCIASTFPDVLSKLPTIALRFASPPAGAVLAPASLSVSGHHFFPTVTTPYFDLDAVPSMQLGHIACAKNASVPAPVTGTVPWLQLLAKEATGGLSMVYRMNTAGGAAPATCSGQAATFEIQYAAEYWFFKSS